MPSGDADDVVRGHVKIVRDARSGVVTRIPQDLTDLVEARRAAALLRIADREGVRMRPRLVLADVEALRALAQGEA